MNFYASQVESPSSFGEWFRAQRLAADLSQRGVAAGCGYSSSMVNRVENGTPGSRKCLWAITWWMPILLRCEAMQRAGFSPPARPFKSKLDRLPAELAAVVREMAELVPVEEVERVILHTVQQVRDEAC